MNKRWCDKCHTCWTEACLMTWGPCPFKGCGGRLTMEPPVAQAARKPKEPPTYPLLEQIEEGA